MRKPFSLVFFFFSRDFPGPNFVNCIYPNRLITYFGACFWWMYGSANSSSVFLVKRGHNSLPFGRYFLGNYSPLCSMYSSVFSNVLKT